MYCISECVVVYVYMYVYMYVWIQYISLPIELVTLVRFPFANRTIGVMRFISFCNSPVGSLIWLFIALIVMPKPKLYIVFVCMYLCIICNRDVCIALVSVLLCMYVCMYICMYGYNILLSQLSFNTHFAFPFANRTIGAMRFISFFNSPIRKNLIYLFLALIVIHKTKLYVVFVYIYIHIYIYIYIYIYICMYNACVRNIITHYAVRY